MTRQQYQIGNHKAVCDICGRTRKGSDLRMQWDGLMACRDRCYSPKHPNEYPRPTINDGLPAPNARPRPLAANMPHVTLVNGQTKWDDSTLIWEDRTWLWSDDTTDGTIYGRAD